MTLTRGAVVTDRTGELFLDASAIRAIDGDPGSFWMSPPADLPQTITIALPARSRIDKVGIRSDPSYPANHIRFDSSGDGRAFTPLASVMAIRTSDAQWFNVPATELAYLRVTALDTMQPSADVRLQSILARGVELEPIHARNLAGCWLMNGEIGAFHGRGARATGAVQTGKELMQLEGGFDGRIYRFNWIRGNDYGYALLAIAPGDQRLNAMTWHEEAIPLFFGEAWFGERAQCNGEPAVETDTAERFLRRAGRYSLFGLRFDENGALDAGASADPLQWLTRMSSTADMQLVAHEFRRENSAANRAFAERELQSLRNALQNAGANLKRITYVAKGSDGPRQRPETDAMRSLYSAVDVEIRR